MLPSSAVVGASSACRLLRYAPLIVLSALDEWCQEKKEQQQPE